MDKHMPTTPFPGESKRDFEMGESIEIKNFEEDVIRKHVDRWALVVITLATSYGRQDSK